MIPIIPNKRAKMTENVMSSQANSLSVSAQSVAVGSQKFNTFHFGMGKK